MSLPDRLLQMLRAGLIRERAVSEFVLRNINKYGEGLDPNDPEAVAAWAEDIEDYLLEEVFRPLFTPSDEDQARYAPALRDLGPVSGADVEQATHDFEAEALRAPVALADGLRFDLALRDVLVESYMRPLRLDFAPDDALAQAVTAAVPLDDTDLALALCRKRPGGRRSGARSCARIWPPRGRQATRPSSGSGIWARSCAPAGRSTWPSWASGCASAS